jgi:amino acid permease
MKTASRILTIISMIGTPIILVIYMIIFAAGGTAALAQMINYSSTSTSSTENSAILGAFLVFFFIYAVVQIIVTEITGSILLKKLENAKTKDEVIGPAVWALIFCSVIGGIFALCTKESDYGDGTGIAPVDSGEHTGCC